MKIISKNFIEQEIKNIGFSPEYLQIGLNNHKFLSLKIYDLRSFEANILKQTALSCDCDCAVNKNTVNCKVEKTDCVLSGTISQLIEVSKKLKKQPKNLSFNEISKDIIKQIFLYKKQSVPKIMGILNLTDNSFSDGGEFLDFNNACEHVDKMIRQGAQIIDIGAESTKSCSFDVQDDIQIKRIIPIINYIKEKYPKTQISIDTRSSIVARESLTAGAQIINDVSGLRYDKDMTKKVAKHNAKIVIVHSRSTPKEMDNMCKYKNLIDEVYFELKKQCEYALNSGINPENIIIDVGFGFAKNFIQNIQLLARIEEFKSLGFEILAGASRKRFLQELIGAKTPKEADDITAISSAYFANCKIDYIRVHNVQKTAEAIKFAQIFNQQKI